MRVAIRRCHILGLALLSAGCSHGGGGNPPSPEATRPAPDSFLVALETSRGPITLALHRDWAPTGVDRFYYLLQHRFFDDARFFRVVKGFVAQFGLPADPRLAESLNLTRLSDDPVRHSNLRGTLSFAHAGPGTRSTQLFINLHDNAGLDDCCRAGFAPIGEIVAGVELIDLLNGEYDGEAGPDQDSIRVQGNAYLVRSYPRLDYIRKARIEKEWR
jgi:peptidyl-prolyl cis-trans isomerase A (cyclophilin A)